jgi:hypothetical protein
MHRLLDQSVDGGGNPQQPRAAARLGDLRPAHSLRLVSTFQQLLLDARPVLDQEGFRSATDILSMPAAPFFPATRA